MRTLTLCFAALAVLSACGIKRPLVLPRDIPAYEQKREEKLQKRQAVPEAMLQMNGAT